MRSGIVFFVAVCLVQSLNGLPIDDLINELKPRVIEAHVKVKTVLKQSGIQLKQTYGAIEEAITVLERSLGQQKSELKDAVEKAQTAAATSGKNIDACIQEVDSGLKTWNKGSMEMCRNRPELNHVGLKLVQVAKLERVLGTAIVRCSTSNRGDLKNIKDCVEGVVADVEKQAEDSAEEIDATIAADQEDANKCANTAASELREQLENLANNFSNCVNND